MLLSYVWQMAVMKRNQIYSVKMQEKTEMNGFFVGKRICTGKRNFIFAFVHNSECCWILVFNLSISEMAYSCVTKFNAENLQLHWFSRVILSNEWHFYLCHCSYEINLDLCFFNVKQQLRRVELLKKKKKMKKNKKNESEVLTTR